MSGTHPQQPPAASRTPPAPPGASPGVAPPSRYSSPPPDERHRDPDKARAGDYAARCKALCEKLELLSANVGTSLGADDLAALNAAVTELKAMGEG